MLLDTKLQEQGLIVGAEQDIVDKCIKTFVHDFVSRSW